MKRYYYMGLDIHKKTISYCLKKADGTVVMQGKVRATRGALSEWLETVKRPWVGGMEATMFTGWVYDFLKPHASRLLVGHPLRLRAVVAGKHKSDRLDARTLADLLRCDLFPACFMMSERLRGLRRVLRYRTLLVREATRMKNKTAGLLMEVGAEYNKQRLAGKRYFDELLEALEVPRSVLRLLRLTRESQEFFEENQRWLMSELGRHPELRERVERLRTIRGVGLVTALTWVLEVGDPQRFRTVKNAVSYCGLCGGFRESAGKVKRMPLSKQRNAHLQTILIEAAKLAPRWNPELREVYERSRAAGADANQATLEVARKLVAYLRAVDQSGQPFEVRTAA